MANQTPKGVLVSLFVKNMAMGIPFCDKTDEAFPVKRYSTSTYPKLISGIQIL